MYKLSPIWSRISKDLFPEIEETLPPLLDKQRQLVAIFEMIRIEDVTEKINTTFFGRPKKDRAAIARAFVAKAVYNLPTTRLLIEQLQSNTTLRRLCGWEYRRDIPSEATFSRAFDEFANSELPVKVHEHVIKTQLQDHLVGHISRDSTAIEGNEKPTSVKKKNLNHLKKPVVPGRENSVLPQNQLELKIS